MTTEKRRIWGWYFFDWASQPYNTLVLTFVFGPYFASVALDYYLGQGQDPEAARASAQAAWAWGQTASGVVIALLAPVLGAIADGSGRRMVWIWLFSAMYVAGAMMLWTLAPEADALTTVLVWFAIGLIGMEFATIFTNALMPDLVAPEEMGKVSGNGFAFGYFGGIIALALMLLLFVESGDTGKTLIKIDPILGLDAAEREGTRAVGPFTAIWYALFMIPFFLLVREAPRRGPVRGVGQSLGDLGRLLASLPSRQSLFAYLMSSMFYRDSLNALYGFGGTYAFLVLGWSVTQVGLFGIVGAITATLFAWLGGKMDSARGPKPVIVLSILVLIAVCLVVLGMSRQTFWGFPFAGDSTMPDVIFYVCGALIGAAGGTLQAASRTLMVFHADPGRASEAFGLYALSGKATAFLGPFTIGVATTMTGSQQWGMAPLVVLFVIGLVLLVWVRPAGDSNPSSTGRGA
jgi:UMF1 family MFS transporter